MNLFFYICAIFYQIVKVKLRSNVSLLYSVVMLRCYEAWAYTTYLEFGKTRYDSFGGESLLLPHLLGKPVKEFRSANRVATNYTDA